MEEAEWFGLPVMKAITKQKIEDARDNKKLPLKYELTRNLLEELKSMCLLATNHCCYTCVLLVFLLLIIGPKDVDPTPDQPSGGYVLPVIINYCPSC